MESFHEVEVREPPREAVDVGLAVRRDVKEIDALRGLRGHDLPEELALSCRRIDLPHLQRVLGAANDVERPSVRRPGDRPLAGFEAEDRLRISAANRKERGLAVSGECDDRLPVRGDGLGWRTEVVALRTDRLLLAGVHL